jgi:hypothetical protein
MCSLFAELLLHYIHAYVHIKSVKDKDDPLQVKQYYDSTGLKRLLLAELARNEYGFFKPPLLKRKMLPWGR